MYRKVSLALAATVATVGTAVLVPGTAFAATYDGADPNTTHCANTASTKRSATIYRQGNRTNDNIIGRIELRYSSSCRTVWGRVVIFTDSASDYVEVVRNSDGAVQGCYDAFWQSSLGGYSCYTPMLNDRNVTSYATGGRNVDGETEYTGSY